MGKAGSCPKEKRGGVKPDFKVKLGVSLFILQLWGLVFYANAYDISEGTKKEIEGFVKAYWNAMLSLDYEKAYAFTDCGDYSSWLNANGSGMGIKDEDRGWFFTHYKIVAVKMAETNQAVVVVNYFKAGPNTAGYYYTRAEVWRKRGKAWVRKCDVGTF